MAHHISRDITPLTITFTENTDISLDSNRHMMLHELQKLMQEIRNMKVDLHNNEEKSKRLKMENDTHIQKLLDEMKEMKLYINELEMEKQRVTDIREKHNQEINELRTKISGQETKNSELERKCCQMQTEIAILKENITKSVTINGLYEQMLKDCKSGNWSKSVKLMKRYLDNSTLAYEQLNNITDYYNYPLKAAKRGYIELIQVMLDYGLPINNQYDFKQHTMLHKAAEYGQYNLVKFFIERGADVNVRNRWNSTPLHTAARQGHENIVQMLVESGADINITSNFGETPLHYAARHGHESIAQYLVNKGCDNTITNKDGLTAADIAATEDIKKIILGKN